MNALHLYPNTPLSAALLPLLSPTDIPWMPTEGGSTTPVEKHSTDREEIANFNLKETAIIQGEKSAFGDKSKCLGWLMIWFTNNVSLKSWNSNCFFNSRRYT